jgi:hypothetical protein
VCIATASCEHAGQQARPLPVVCVCVCVPCHRTALPWGTGPAPVRDPCPGACLSRDASWLLPSLGGGCGDTPLARMPCVWLFVCAYLVAVCAQPWAAQQLPTAAAPALQAQGVHGSHPAPILCHPACCWAGRPRVCVCVCVCVLCAATSTTARTMPGGCWRTKTPLPVSLCLHRAFFSQHSRQSLGQGHRVCCAAAWALRPSRL